MLRTAKLPVRRQKVSASKMAFWVGPLYFLILFLAIAAAPSNFDSQSDQIAKDIERQRKSLLFPKVLVIDFPLQTTGINSLSSFLADDLSAALEARLPSGTIIPRSKLREFLGSQGISPLDLQAVSVAFWASDKLDANEIIVGDVSTSDETIDLRLKLLRLGDAKEAATWSFGMPLNEELRAKRAEPLEWSGPGIPPNVALRCSSENSIALSKAFTDAGGTLPKATYWPNPPFSEEARKNKLQGSRKYDVFLDEQGNPFLIIPHRPLQPEFDGIAIETIKSWKSQPATMGGKPVAVCTTIEINWRLY